MMIFEAKCFNVTRFLNASSAIGFAQSPKTTVFILSQVIKMLTEKCKSQEAEINEFQMREEEFQQMEAEADLLRRQVQSSRLVFCFAALSS